MSNKPRRTSSSRTPFHSSVSSTFTEEATPEGHRQARLEHLVQHELQSILRDEVADPSLEGLTVLSVQLSPDQGHARVAYAIAAPLHLEQQRARASKAGLTRATGFLRSRLADHLNLKKLPLLSFTFVGVSPLAPGGEPCLE